MKVSIEVMMRCVKYQQLLVSLIDAEINTADKQFNALPAKDRKIRNDDHYAQLYFTELTKKKLVEFTKTISDQIKSSGR